MGMCIKGASASAILLSPPYDLFVFVHVSSFFSVGFGFSFASNEREYHVL